MASLRTYIPGDLALLRVQPDQAGEHRAVLQTFGMDWMPQGRAETLLSDGHVRACAGLSPVWPGRAVAWAFFADDLSIPEWGLVFRALKAALAACGDARIEATCRAEFLSARRFLEKLGFGDETPAGMEAYADGRCYHLYARLQNGAGS